MSRGYVLVAGNDHHYLELAVSAACSLRVNDDKPIALLISGGVSVPRKYYALFDYVIAFDPRPPFDGDFLRRFVIETYTPFEKAMHVDADCFLVGPNIQYFWDRFDSLAFGVMANFRTSGKCYRDQIEVDKIIACGMAPGVYETNWGIFYYHNNGANEVMARGRELVRRFVAKDDDITTTYFSRPGQLSDEPIWGIALAQSGIRVLPFDYTNQLQVTSPNSSNHVFDYANKTFSVQKGGISNVRGQFYHYAEMYPLKCYLEGVIHYRRAMNVELPRILTADGRVIEGRDWATRIEDIVDSLYREARVAFKFVT